jgi:glycosyltransferase involved in cell wall biosynthesis
MIRVLYTINNLDTAGSKYVVANLVRGLDRTRFAPSVAVNRRTGSPLERELEKLCPVIEIQLRVPRRPRWRFPARVWTTARSLAGNYDIAHSFDYVSDWSEGAVMKLAGIPWIVEKTNLSFSPSAWRARLLLARHIVVLSQAQREQLDAWRHKLSLVPIGIVLDAFEKARPAARQEWGFGEDDVVLISVAHLVPVKGHKELIAALASVREQVPRLRLLLVGGGSPEYTAELKAQVDAAGLGEAVRFAGSSDKVPALLAMADGKVLATRNDGRKEAFGTAIIEAMAAGLPVIATRSGGPEDIVVPGETGWLVEANQADALAAAMLELYRSRDLRRRLGDNGRRRARELYSVERMVERSAEIYRRLLARA